MAAGVMGWTGGSIALFRRLRESLSSAEAPLHPLVELLGGLGVVALAGLVPLAGGLLGLALFAVGLGAVLTSRFGTRPPEPVVPTAAKVPPGSGTPAGGPATQPPAAQEAPAASGVEASNTAETAAQEDETGKAANASAPAAAGEEKPAAPGEEESAGEPGENNEETRKE